MSVDSIKNALVPIWETVRRTGVPLSEFEARAYGGDLEVWWRPTSPIPGCFGRWTGVWTDVGEPCVVSEPFLVAPEVLQLQLGPFKSLFCMGVTLKLRDAHAALGLRGTTFSGTSTAIL